jgi:hypothetical protein
MIVCWQYKWNGVQYWLKGDGYYSPLTKRHCHFLPQSYFEKPGAELICVWKSKT